MRVIYLIRSIDWVGIGKEEAIETEIGTFMENYHEVKRQQRKI